MQEERVWNCKSSTFCLSVRELRNPALSLEKALSSGANRVNPPELEVTSCELSWFMSCVVLRRRVRTENLLAFLRIWTVLNPGAGAVAGGEWSAGDGREGWDSGGDGSDGDVVGG